MAEVELSARVKYPCPACGAEAVWNPAKKALVCGFCGTTAPCTEPTVEEPLSIKEHPLLDFLKNLPEIQRGIGAPKKQVRCQHCQAITLFDEKKAGGRCDFCGSTSLLSVNDVPAAVRPESLLMFKIEESFARDIARDWYGKNWFAKSNLKKKALTDTVHGVYLPYWTFDAFAYIRWKAEIGHYEGTGKERTTRWETVSGEMNHLYDDVLVPGSKGVKADRLAKIEPFPTKELVPYNPQFLAGWNVEQYQIDLVKAYDMARDIMAARNREMVVAQLHGDTHRNVEIYPNYTAQTFKHVLLPVWILSYTYGSKTYQVVINGYTGEASGTYPLSWIKIAFVASIALLILYFIITHSK